MAYGRKIEGFLTLDITDFTRKMSMVDTHLSSSSKNFGSFNNAMGDTTTKAGQAGNAVEKVGQNATNASTSMNKAGQAGTQMGNDISRGANVGSTSLNKVSTSATGVTSSLEGISTALTGVVAGFGAMEMVTMAWTGSTQAQFNQAYLSTKMSTSAAQQYISTIQGIVAVVPGDDTFMNQILTGAVARQTNLTTAQITSLAYAVADYTTVSQAMGKSQIETQMDLKEYVQTGNTSQLERDSILKNQMSTLEGQATVSDRILALNTALKAEGYAGLSQLDIASIKWEELKGKFQMAATTLGTRILPTVQGILEFFIDLDTRTGGWSTTIMFLGAGVIAIGAAFGFVAMALAPISGFLAPIALGIINILLPMAGLEVTAITASGGFMTLIGAIVGVDAAALTGAGAFSVLAGAIWTSITPLLPFIAAGIALAGVIYYIGLRMQWWTDIGSMGSAVWAGIQRIWASFVNNPAVIGFLDQLKLAWSGIVTAVTPIMGLFGQVWSALFPANPGQFDIVRTIIDGFGWLGNTIMGLFSYIQGNPVLNTLFTVLLSLINPIFGVVYGFEQLGEYLGLWSSWGQMVGVVFGSLVGFLGQVGKLVLFVGGLWYTYFFQPILEGAGAILNAIGPPILGALTAIGGAISWALNGIGGAVSGILEYIRPTALAIVDFLRPIICILLGCSPGIVPALQSTYNWFVTVFGGIWSFISPIVSMMVSGLGGIWSALSQGDLMGAFTAGLNSLTGVGTYIIGLIQSVDWNGVFMTILTSIASFASQNNPVTWITTLLFGADAGTSVSTAIFNSIMFLGTTFLTGLNVLWSGLQTAVSFMSGLWNNLIFATQFAWALIQMYIMNPVRAIWATVTIVWNSIWATINGVWTRLYSGATTTFNGIKSAIMSPFATVKSWLTTTWNGLKTGWNNLVSTFKSGAQRLKDAVMSPIKTVYNGLVDLWNLVTGGHVAKMAGSSGVAGSSGLAGGIGLSGPAPTTNSGGGRSFGILTGIGNTVRSFINSTANNNGLKGRFAGTNPVGGIGRGPRRDDECSPDEPCYAGWDQMGDWKGKINSILTSWPTKAVIGGVKVTSGLMDALLHGGGSMAVFDAVASSIIGKTRYEYYYNARYSDAQVISGGRCNCFDGAELLIHLAQRLGLSAYMGHGSWGADGHAFAVINNQVRDTTAFQKGYGWRSPKVRGYPSAGPSPRYAGSGDRSVENHFHFNITGPIYGMDDVEKKMEKTADKVYTKRINKNRANGA